MMTKEPFILFCRVATASLIAGSAFFPDSAAQAALTATAGLLCLFTSSRPCGSAFMTVYADLCIWAATAFATMAAGKAIAAILGFASFALYIASVFTGHAVDAAKRSGSIAFGGILLISALASLLLPQPIHIMILSAGIFILSLYYYFNNSTATK